MKNTRKKSSVRRGMSLPELMISVTMFTMVGLFVSYISIAVGNQARDSLSQVPAEQQSFRAMDYIRRDLLPGIGGTVWISEDKSTIQFQHALRPAISSIYFDAASQRLIFDPNITTTGDEIPFGRGLTGSFEIVPDTRRVRVSAISTAFDKRQNRIQISYRDEMTLRN